MLGKILYALLIGVLLMTIPDAIGIAQALAGDTNIDVISPITMETISIKEPPSILLQYFVLTFYGIFLFIIRFIDIKTPKPKPKVKEEKKKVEPKEFTRSQMGEVFKEGVKKGYKERVVIQDLESKKGKGEVITILSESWFKEQQI